MAEDMTPLTADDVTFARDRMLADPGQAYAILMALAHRWVAQHGLARRPGCEALSDIVKARFGLDQPWSGIWYHLGGRHRGMDINSALALLGAIREDVSRPR